MQLYYSPGACSLASHIALTEAGANFGIVKVNLKDKLTESGKDFNAINPKGYVPALMLDSGELLTENTALLGYIGELDPKARLIPKAGTVGNLRVREWLGYINSELHKQCGPLLRRSGAPGQELPDRRGIHRRRQLSVYRPELGGPAPDRSDAVAEPAQLHGARQGAPGCPVRAWR